MLGRPSGAPAATDGRLRFHSDLVLAAVALVAACVCLAFVVRGPALPDEYIYLAGARWFAETGSLDARVYSHSAILNQSYPHQDMHAPGYVILLGAWMRLLPFGYASAVALNVAACVALAPLAAALGRRLNGAAAWPAGLAAVALPAYLPYVSWVMPEVLIGTLILATLVLAAGTTRASAWGAGACWCAALLVRESAVFVLPAALWLVWRTGRMRAFVAMLAVGVLAVYLPLSRERGEGGTNVWRETTENSAIQFSALRSLAAGDVSGAWAGLVRRARENVEMVRRSFSPVETASLGLVAALPVLALARRRGASALGRETLIALALGVAALVFVMVAVLTVPPWSGIRYAMALGPPFVAALGPRVLALVIAVSLGLNAGTVAAFDRYKESRQRRQQGLTEYVDRYVPDGQKRVVISNGYHYVWRHYPVEVIGSAPEDLESLRLFGKRIWFDYLALPPDSELRKPLEKRERYERLNADDPEPLLLIYRRLR
jgi:hypothetical protein